METDLTALSQEVKSFTTEAKGTLAKLGENWNEAANRLLTLEQRMTSRGDGAGMEEKSLGSLVTESEGFKALQMGTKSSGQIKIGSFHGTKTALVNATGQNQPLVADMRVPGIIPTSSRKLTVRDLL